MRAAQHRHAIAPIANLQPGYTVGQRPSPDQAPPRRQPPDGNAKRSLRHRRRNVMTAAAATTTPKAAHPALSNKAREMMEAINAEAGKHNVWVRTQANAPAQRPWFSATSAEGSGKLASGRVAVAQMKTAPHIGGWRGYSTCAH